jgi:FkbM family methyltransferase
VRGPAFYEPEVRHRLERFKGGLFVDIGANQGLYCIPLSKNFLQVYAFEPNPNVIPLLTKELQQKRVRNVKVFPMALGDIIGRTTLYLDRHTGFGASLDTILPVYDYKPQVIPPGGRPQTYVGKNGVEVEVSTYDAIVREPADLVKIDVEGAEFLVVNGMRHSLENGMVKRVLVELHDRDRSQDLEILFPQYSIEWIDRDHLLAILLDGQKKLLH